MNAMEAIASTLKSTQRMLNWYVSDLSDSDLLVRPAPTANHIAWQIGHLISAERNMTSGLPYATPVELPAGFKEQHTKQTASEESSQGFLTKAEYVDLFNKVRQDTLAIAEKVSEAELDRPTTGDMAKFAPTVGAMLLLQANHTLMHVGQFTVVRRKLGKPVLF